MPRFNRQRVSKIPFKPFDAEKKDSAKNDSNFSSRIKGVKSAKFAIPTSVNLNRSKQPRLPQNVLSSNIEEMRMVDSVPPKSTMHLFSGESPLKSRKDPGSRLPTRDTSFLNQKESSSDIMVSDAFIKKERGASRFLSVSMGKGRTVRHKATQLSGQGVSWHSKVTNRLSCAKRIQLFQALSKEPSCFLDLHVRFGTSKQTIRRLVANGFLREVWGSNSIGVWFKLTDKGNTYLKMLKATSRHDSSIVQKNPVRLKHKI